MSLLFRLTTAVLATLLAVALAGFASEPSRSPATRPDANGYVGNEACGKCHASIYESYKNTAMAHASGPAADNLIAGDFSHPASGVNYRIYSDAGKVWLSFDRAGDPSVHGKRELLYFIGQGRRGRTYLFPEDGFVFESPVNWYADRHMWDMAPAYGNSREIPMTLPALTSCLDCHVSGIRPPIRGTENRYNMPLFAFAGVTCERCHGPGAAHVNGGAIVNPAKLSADRRDQVCMQCHLEGNAAIERAGKHLYEYRPGDDLSDYIRYYLLMDSHSPNLRAASQFEALAESTCKKKSGDAMSCTSCHDPHRAIPADERVSFYRAKCLACHGAAFGAKHHIDQPDCAHCHMPAALSSDVAHTEVTDHRIPRRPSSGPGLENAGPPSSPQLVAFPKSKDTERDVRDLALAWQSIVDSGMTVEQPQAEKLLRQAVVQFPNDTAVLSALGYVEQKQGANDRARELYQQGARNRPGSYRCGHEPRCT